MDNPNKTHLVEPIQNEGAVQTSATHVHIQGDLEMGFSKISEACSCLDECMHLLKVGPSRPGHDQHRDAIRRHVNSIKEHASEIQVALIALSDETMQSGHCSPASTREHPSAFGSGPSHSVAVAMTDESRPALKVVRSTDPEWSYDEMMAKQIRWWSKRRPNSSFCPITIGQDVPMDQRQRHLLWNHDDVDAAFGSDFALEMFGLKDADHELDNAIQAALECISELHQWGRVTAHGMAVGAVRAFIENYPLFKRYLDRSRAQTRSPDKIRDEIEVRVRGLQALCVELGEARNEDVRRKD
ncbi:hypothetical protein E3H11_10545 [Bradyrhizobium brasilense]|uniref:hypothetical protein n=1 Tax=Bradyrhizobium brasilense TaxID=1419277 RepID=UPI0014573F59|nr:hypothetical protein [Bradyrhizobium brasilense]NLS69350.1 hypothetical protein [Bradyrhizobium brasilense]